MYKLSIYIKNSDFTLEIFKILEKEVNFARGRLYVENGKIVAEARDASSLRSLIHTVFRAIYVAEYVDSLELTFI